MFERSVQCCYYGTLCLSITSADRAGAICVNSSEGEREGSNRDEGDWYIYIDFETVSRSGELKLAEVSDRLHAQFHDKDPLCSRKRVITWNLTHRRRGSPLKRPPMRGPNTREQRWLKVSRTEDPWDVPTSRISEAMTGIKLTIAAAPNPVRARAMPSHAIL